MKKGGAGGGNTITGLAFERKTDISALFKSIKGYATERTANGAGYKVYYEGEEVARCFQKNAFYRFLEEFGINWKEYLSAKLLPDNGIFLIARDTLFIVEVKYQEVGGSVDEKLQTCDFKRKQYAKLVRPLNWFVEYIYILNDWFKNPRYKDTLDYICSMNCRYFFNEIPIRWFGLPSPEERKEK